ncbi:MAG: glycoside hydrolase family 2 protein [Lachnospiraceae bacterium]|nr:glycoside hydrolase family 2 protein [Lachnospiraceae bacterium]
MGNVLNINENWIFLKGISEIPNAMPDNGEKVTLPHTWNAIDGQDGGNDYFRGKCLYIKSILKSEMPKGEQYYLEINGANSSADVYVNGNKLAHHDGGYSTWRVNMTKALEGENFIVVMVDNEATDKVYPQTADFTFYGGLYRDVNIIAVNDTHFDLDYYGGRGIQVTPIVNGGNAKISVKTYVSNIQSGDNIEYILRDAEGKVVTETVSAKTEAEFAITNPHLWDGRRDPYLYTAEASIIRNGEKLDTVSVRFGCRSFEIDPERGFILNGREYPLRGVSRHQDRLGIGNALLPEHHEEDMDLICEVGANTIRLAHYQHDQYFYDLCDERGMVVWAEIPYISQHISSANDNTISQMKELVVQNYNHPSIVVWGLSNEITMDGAKDEDMLKNHHFLNDMVHKMDSTRLTTMACITMCDMDEDIVHVSDVVSYNHYFGWYGGSTEDNGVWFDKFHKKYPNRAIGCSEYGCEGLNWHTSNPRQGDYTEEYQAYYHEELIKQLFTRPYLWATHVWNMFDFGADARAEGGENGQNHKGLVTFDRKYKKDSFYAYKAWLSDEPFVHICGKRYVDRVEDVTKVTVYSNQPEVELFINGESLGIKKEENHFFYFDVPNSGDTNLLAVAGQCKDEAYIRKVKEVNQDYILREQGAVLNWFDITEIEGRFSLNDTFGDITKTFRGKLWFLGLFVNILKKFSGKKKNSVSGEKKKSKRPEINSGLMKMLMSFTVLRFTSMVGMVDISYTKEELLKMNRKLNKISKKR